MMAKKSEFARKLLDDLRMRKERMAAGTWQQTYGQSYSLTSAQDAHSQSIKDQRSARVIAACKTGSSKMDGVHRRSSTHTGPIGVENSSKQLVPFSQDHQGNAIGDVSAVIDFVFKNGNKLMIDSSMRTSILAFLQQISHGPVIDFRNSEQKGNVKISTFHINEVSKGAKKLNNILAASTKGLNPDRCSIEIGTELFRSAKDLEESLRMLLSLQEAANNMTTQRKTKIKLLEGSEEDKDENRARLENQKQIDRPRFTFDEQSNSNKREASNSIRQRSVALAYLNNQQLPNAENSLNLVSTASVRRSHIHDDEFSGKTAASEKSKETTNILPTSSKPEKKCLPNIIAKLMGLEELSQHSESKSEMRKETESKLVGKVKLTPHSTGSHLKNKGAVLSQAQTVKTRLLQADRIPIYIGASFDKHENNRQSNGNLRPQNGIQGRNKLNKDMENAEAKSLCMLEKNVTRLTQHHVNQKGTQERRKNFAFANDINAKTSTRGVSRTNQKYTNAFPEKETRKERNFELEIRNSNRQFAQNQQKTQTGFELSKRKLFGQPEIINQRHKPDRIEHKFGKNELHKKVQEGSEAARISMKGDPQSKHEIQQHHTRKSASSSAELHLEVTRDRDDPDDDTSCRFPDNLEIDKESDHNPISKDQGIGAESKKTSNPPPLKEDKYVQVKNSMNKVPKSKVQKSNTLKMVDQVVSKKKNLPQSFNRPLEHQSTTLKETEFQHEDRRCTKWFTDDSSRSDIEPLQTTATPPQNQVGNPSVVQKPDLTDITHIIASQASSDEHAPICGIENTREPIACIVQSKKAGVKRMSSEISNLLQVVADETHKTKKPDPLNEEETQLKYILVLDQQFLSTAEALFKLNIPVNILQADNRECDSPKHIHVLQAVCEIMNRKAKIQELKINPFSKGCISFPKLPSLHDLVKQLHKDLETLKCYGGEWGDDIDTGAYLLKMVERDMHCTDPDINCMWEYSWNNSSFALAEKYETIQELEKSIADELMDDIFQDIFLSQITKVNIFSLAAIGRKTLKLPRARMQLDGKPPSAIASTQSSLNFPYSLSKSKLAEQEGCHMGPTALLRKIPDATLEY